MAAPPNLALFVATTTITASAVGLWAVWPDSPDAPAEQMQAQARLPTEPLVPPDEVTLCVGPAPDRILRATRADGTCPPDHKELLLEEDQGTCELCDPEEVPRTPDTSRNSQLDALEQRIRELENTAYFEVVTDDGRPVFRVGPGGVRVFNPAATAVAAIGTSEGGGYFTGRSTGGARYASIGASGSNAGVRLLERDLSRVELAVRDGGASLRLPSMAGLIAGIGESRVGPGILLTGTLAGSMRASFTVPDGRGMIATNGAGESGGTAILEPAIGGGMLGLDDTRGNAAVKMGHNGHRYGIVMAGPLLGFPLIPKSGLPGSYFMGCASDVRPACVPTIEP